MGSYRRPSAIELKRYAIRRRSSRDFAVPAYKRANSSTYASSRSKPRAYLGREFADDDIEISQPPLEELPVITGYEYLSFDLHMVPPPDVDIPAEILEEEEFPIPITLIEPPPPNESEIRVVLMRHVSSKCNFEKNTAREMRIIELEYHPEYKYTLESFTEMRQVAWSFEPYNGSTLDEASSSSIPPGPWSVACTLPTAFQSSSTTVDVPHTDVLKTCHCCGGSGSKRCLTCSAAGWKRCSYCLGDGYKLSLQGHRERCFRCLGTGRKTCWRCGGETMASCAVCGGTGQIRCFISLTISWTTHVDEYVIESSEAIVIGKKLESAEGYVAFADQQPLLSPITIPDFPLSDVSSSLLIKHQSYSSLEKVLLQRHSLQSIPIHCIKYEWQGEIGRFFIYGRKKEVYAPDYPKTLCCCVII